MLSAVACLSGLLSLVEMVSSLSSHREAKLRGRKLKCHYLVLWTMNHRAFTDDNMVFFSLCNAEVLEGRKLATE